MMPAEPSSQHLSQVFSKLSNKQDLKSHQMSNYCFLFKGAIAKRVSLVNLSLLIWMEIAVDCRFGKFIVDVDLLCYLLVDC